MMRTWDATCSINGVDYPVIGGLPTRTLTLDGRQTAAANLRALPADALGALASFDLWIDGERRRLFTGIVAPFTRQITGAQRQLNVTDSAESKDVLNLEIRWRNVAYEAGLRAVLTLCGITPDLIDAIDDPLAGYDPATFNNATYQLGPIADSVIARGESAWQLATELLAFGGLRLHFLPSGHVRVVHNVTHPRATSDITYSSTPGEGEYGITDAGMIVVGTENTLASYFATGPRLMDGHENIARSTRGDGPVVNDTFRLAQSAWVCKLISDRELARRARFETNYWFDAPLSLDIVPGVTIWFYDPVHLGMAAPERVIVTDVATTEQADMRVSISAGPSLIIGYDQTLETSPAPPIYPDFTAFILLHPVDGDDQYLVQCEASSLSLTGTAITGHTWDVTGSTFYAGPSGAIDRPVFGFTTVGDGSIEMTATDDDAETRTIERFAVTRMTGSGRRTLTTAAGTTGWRVYYNGAWATFLPASGNCTAVPEQQGDLPPLAGFASGAIYRSDDYLDTTPALVATLSGSIGLIAPVPWAADAVLVAHGNSLSLLRLNGATRLVTTFAAPVKAVLWPGSSGATLLACVGKDVVRSINGGATWAAYLAGPTGATARGLARSPQGHVAAVWSDATNEAGAVVIVGQSVDWSGVDAGERPSTLRSVAAMLSSSDFLVSEATQVVRDEQCPGIVHTLGTGRVYRLTWTGDGYDAAQVATVASEQIGVLALPGYSGDVSDTATTMIGCGPITPLELLPPPIPGAALLTELGGALLTEDDGRLLLEEQ
jgi:hypothetical protein